MFTLIGKVPGQKELIINNYMTQPLTPINSLDDDEKYEITIKTDFRDKLVCRSFSFFFSPKFRKSSTGASSKAAARTRRAHYKTLLSRI